MASNRSISVQSAATSRRLKSGKNPDYAVTLLNSRGASLFQLTLKAGSEPDAVAQAQCADWHELVGLGDLRDLSGADGSAAGASRKYEKSDIGVINSTTAVKLTPRETPGDRTTGKTATKPLVMS